jgi:hypothetical protein
MEPLLGSLSTKIQNVASRNRPHLLPSRNCKLEYFTVSVWLYVFCCETTTFQQVFNQVYCYGIEFWISEVILLMNAWTISISWTFHSVVHCVIYQIINVCEKIFCCNPFIEERHSHVWKNLRPTETWMINLVSTVEQSCKAWAKCKITFFKTTKPVLY